MDECPSNGEWKLLTGDPSGAERAEFNDSDWQAVTIPMPGTELRLPRLHPRPADRHCLVPQAFSAAGDDDR
jgi:hypothetical protein